MYQKWLDLRDGFEHPEPFHVYYQFGLSWPTSGRSSMSRLLLLNWRATLGVGPISIPSSVPIIIPASERDLSRRFTVTGFLDKLAWRKHTSFWSQNGWSCFVELIKKITANGEVITNLLPTLQEDQNDLLVFKKYTLSKPKLRHFTDLTNYLLSIEDPMLDSQELIVF